MGIDFSRYPGQPTEEVSPRERAARALARRAAAEGMVLLENDGILPLKRGARLALFGAGARHTIKGGTGSGDVNARDVVSVDAGLRAAGFQIVNTEYLDAFDRAWAGSLAEWERAIYAAAGEQRDAMRLYEAHARLSPRAPELPLPPEACRAADAVLYVISRVSGEAADRRDAPGDYRLSALELDQLRRLRASGRPLVVILNVGGVMDLSFLDDIGVSALVLMSQAGSEGGSALADVLSGAVNPSGRLTDTWAMRYADYPSAGEYADNHGERAESRYGEGIYVGYRWFDSFGVKPRYPFGYGLSYTRFEWEPLSVQLEGATARCLARVCNAGPTAGRAVLQLYAACPREPLTTEAKRLVAFGKTAPLPPGGEAVLALDFGLEALTVYHEGLAAELLQAGDYALLAGWDCASARPVARLRLAESVVARRLSNVCELLDALAEPEPPRGDPRWDFPLPDVDITAAVRALADESIAPRAEDDAMRAARAVVARLSDAQKCDLVVGARGGSTEFIGTASLAVPGAAGETVGMPDFGVPRMILADGPAGVRLQQHYEIDPDTGEMIFPRERFEVLENRFFGKAPHRDGAVSRWQFATAIPIGTLLAQSFDTALAEEVGGMIADELRALGVSLWLAPGMNIHRNPLCGRNFEYFSEDPLLSGRMAAAITRGVQRRGDVGVCVKHFACNSQEDNRMHVSAVISERALREIYLKGFEIAVRTAQPASIMTAYNRINGVHCANSRDLCDTVARREWGFEGLIMTDWCTTNAGGGSSAAKCIRAGNDLIMPGRDSDAAEILAALRGEKGPRLDPARLDESAARVVRAALLLGKSDNM